MAEDDHTTRARKHFIAELSARDVDVARTNSQFGTYSDEYRRALGRWTRARKALERITRSAAENITADNGELLCLCGNDAPNYGFAMSDTTGEVTFDPDSDGCAFGWDGTHYVCNQCGRVIDQDTGRVVARAGGG
jgi:hypothetical protein